MIFQTTLQKEVSCWGLGLHSGKKVHIRLSPSTVNSGIKFFRTDKGSGVVEARNDYVSSVNFATTLTRNGYSITTVEHLLAAIYALGISNINIHVDAEEVPIMDGSAAPYLVLLDEAGIKRLPQRVRYLKLIDTITVRECDRVIEAYPSDQFQITYKINFDHPAIGIQEQNFIVKKRIFRQEISPARTFGFLDEVETMRRNGLALGGGLHNAIILSENGVLNKNLRFQDEFVRHKILDLIGDLSLLGYPLLAHIKAYKAGHCLHFNLVSEILKNREKWILVEGFRMPSGKITFGQILSPASNSL